MKYDWFIYFIIALMSLLTSVILFQKNLHAETNTVSSTVVNNTPPTANAPSIINSNSDICKVGVGASVQNNIVGLATGVVIDDELCQKLKLSRSLYGFGMKVAAVSVLCQDPRVWSAMTDAGTPCPVQGLIGAEAAQYWKDNPDQIPDGSKYKTDYVTTKKEEQPVGDNDGLKNFGLMALSLLLLL
jgi:hypothetical protein